MKSLFYSLLVVVSFSLMSCEKQDVSERDRLTEFQGLDKKEGDDDGGHVVIHTVLNQSNQPVENAVVHCVLSSSSQCVDISTTDINGNSNAILETENYFFKVYLNGILVYTSSNHDVNSDLNISHKLP